MTQWLALLAPLVAQFAVPDAGRSRAPRALVEIACLLLAGFAAVIAAGCIVATLWLFLLPRIGPVWAPASCAGALIVICVILVVVGTQFLRRPKAAAPSSMLIEFLQNGSGEKFIRDHKTDFLLAALVIGLVAGGTLGKSSQDHRAP